VYLNAKWNQKNNFLDLPTDCPQRDERMGWTGDAQMFCKTACYNMDTYAFYRKYLRDIWVEQKEFDGRVGHVAPSFFKDYNKFNAFWQGGSCAWGDAAVIIPWTLYEHYGDTAILEECYQSMTGWINWIDRTALNKDGLWEHGFKFGDWLALDGDPNLVPINTGSGTGAEEALQPEPAATGAEIPNGAEYDTKEGPAVDEGKPTTVGDKLVEEDAPQQTSQSTVTADDLTKVIVRKIKQNRSNTQKIGAILKTFGVAKVSELSADKYEAFLTELAQL
jgi:hypothetical protein